MATQAASNLRKRRGVSCSSVTKLNERITELENITDAHRVVDPARQMLTRLQTFDSDFKKSHFDLIDLIDETNTTALDIEQAVIDKFDDDVSSYTLRLEALVKRAPAAPQPEHPLCHRLIEGHRLARCLVFGLPLSKLTR